MPRDWSSRLHRAMVFAIGLLSPLGAGAAPLLRPAGAPMPGTPGAAQVAARAAQTAGTQARQANESLSRAFEAMQRFRAQQDQARAAAALGPSAVPNGLTPGGLVVVPGASGDPDLWSGAGQPTQTSSGQLTNVEIVQDRPKAILTWQTFNVGRETEVHFDQRAGGDRAQDWIALNRVNDPSARPSQILGSIRAEGQVYLINPNGIIFGGASQVNVNTLLASSLDLYGATLRDRNQHFYDGILYNPQQTFTPSLAFGERLDQTYDELRPNPNANHDPNETFASGDGVTIQAGARLRATGGFAMLLGHNVQNDGEITATDGQVVLGAGRGVYLNVNVPRGFYREGVVNFDNINRGLTIGVNRGGSVVNNGSIQSDRGSVKITGKSILQNGLITATTSASANGLITMTAGDGVSQALGVANPDPTNFTSDSDLARASVGVMGDLTFAEGSRTQILPDGNGERAIGFNQFRSSVALLSGRNITFGRDSVFYAPGASLTVDAQRGPPVHEWVRDSSGALTETPDSSRIYLSPGATLDVSGLRGVSVPMERNSIAAELRANELRDNPLMRDGFLRGSTVNFDARRGIAIADASGYYGLIARDVTELMTNGGSIQLKAPQIVTRPGSLINLAGGSLQVQSGYVQSTRLIDPSGRAVWIEDADPSTDYLGFYGRSTVEHRRWGVRQSYPSPIFREDVGRYQEGYLEGRSAGTLTLGQTSEFDRSSGAYGYRVLEGDIKADVVVGPNQRDAPSGATAENVTRVWRERPLGGTLNFGYLERNDVSGIGGLPPVGGSITIGQGPLLPDNFVFDSRIDPSMEYNHVLPARYFDGQTFSVVNLYSGKVGAGAVAPAGRLTIGAGTLVNLGDYGRFNFDGSIADIQGSILAPGGSVSLLTPWVAPRPSDPSDPNPGNPTWSAVDPALRPRITLGPNAVIDVAGRWVNLFMGPDRSQLAIRGGSVSLVTSYELNLAAGSLIDVSGGGRLSADGKKVTAGDAGSILLFNGHTVLGASPAPDHPVTLAGELRGFGLKSGGALTLGTGGSVTISDGPTSFGPNSWVLSPDIFSQGGFSTFIVSGASGVTVAENTVIRPSTQSFFLRESGSSLRTGVRLFGSAELTQLPLELAPPMSLTLSAPLVDAGGSLAQLGPSAKPWTPLPAETPGAVTLATGAQIQMLPRSTLQLISGTNVFVDGTVLAPGGLIGLRVAVEPSLTTSTPAAVRLGEHARLLAPGFLTAIPDADRRFTRRSVQPGGTVRIDWFSYTPLNPDSKTGYVMTDPGSVIDVSGVQGIASLLPVGPLLQPPSSRYVERLIDGKAGSISIGTDIAGGIGGVLAGRLLLAPGGPTGAGGSLDIYGHQLEISQSVPSDLPRVTTNSPIDRTQLNLRLFADRINDSAADDLALRATSTSGTNAATRGLVFAGDVSLSTRRSIWLGGPTIALSAGSTGTVNLSSQYIALNPRNSPSEPDVPTSPFPQSLAGRFVAQADVIDVGYGINFGCGSSPCIAAGLDRGFADVQLIARGDIRLNSEGLAPPSATPRLSTGGTLTLSGAQVYVTTAKSPRVAADSDPGYLVIAGQSVIIAGNGAPAPVPFSYGERLTIRAPEILQAGVLRAPLGEIRLEGSRSVTLAPGSLTSTSLEGQQMISGYSKVTPDDPFSNLAPSGSLDRLPSRTIRIDAPDVNVQEGSTIDVSGGGDVSAWQFIAGTGGSRDILQTPGTFAVIPSFGAGTLPAGWQSRSNALPFYSPSPLRVGDQVYLRDVPGLAPGYYTLLPSSFAQLEGGLLIRALGNNYARLPGATMRPDGSEEVGGYRLAGDTGIRDAGYSRFLVMPASVFNRYSTWLSYSFNDFVASTAAFNGVSARTALDAGTLVLGATGSLTLNGVGRFNGAGSGLPGNLDISSQRIAVVGGGAPAPDGYLSLDADALSRFGAGSIFIGGTRSLGPGGTNVIINASDVIVMNTTANPLTGSEILLGAQNALTLSPGSAVEARGLLIGQGGPLVLSGSGALLRASTGARVDINRINPNGGTSSLNVGYGASLRSSGALSLDASSVGLNPGASFDADQLELSSGTVSMGDVPGSVPGTVLTPATLASLSRARDLLIRGRNSIDLYGTFALGGLESSGLFTLGSLTLDTPILNGLGSSSDVASISAGTLTLRNTNGASSRSPGTAGSLVFRSNVLTFGPGNVEIARFGTVNATADALKMAGTGTVAFDGSMSIAANSVTAGTGSDYTITIGGNLDLTSAGGPAGAADTLGGRLSLSAANLLLNTSVDLPGGIFEAHATAGNLTLGSGGSVKAQGRTVDFRDVRQVAPGGAIRLTATGDLIAANGSRLDVSGDPRGGEAGSIDISAGGSADLQAEVKGTAAEGYWGGSFSLAADRLGDFSRLNRTLESGGMNRRRAIHLVNGDLSLQANEMISARQVTLQSDNGAIFLAGAIYAAGDRVSPSGGSIRLLGGNGVRLSGSARLDAHAASTPAGAFESDSGTVEIAATGGRLDIASGAVIDVSGGKQGGGQVLVRALRVGNDIAVDHLDGLFVGARSLALVGMRTYQVDGSIDPGLSAELADARDWMGHAPEILSRLGAASFQVQPGILLRSSGDLTIDSDIDLFAARYGGAPGYLEFDAARDIQIHGNSSSRVALSDGFDGAGSLAAGESWSYVFRAGQDIVLGDGQGHSGMVRTGTGNIRLEAGRDFRLMDDASVLYTAGSRTETPGLVPIPDRVTGDFPTRGGNIALTAGRDVVAPISRESTSGWLFRYGDTEWTGNPRTSRVAQQTSWSIVFPNFEQGIGALGGGNVEVTAGRDIRELPVSLPTTGYLATPVGSVAAEGDLHIRGGGNLALRAGRDIVGGIFMLGRGDADVSAGGALTYDPDQLVLGRTQIFQNPNGTYTYTPRTLAALFALADATLTVTARSGAEIEGVFDPMLQGQICQNSGCTSEGITSGSAFYGMTEHTSMSVTSVSGNVQYNNNPWASVDVTHSTAREAIMFRSASGSDPQQRSTEAFARVPGSVRLTSLAGDLVLASKVGQVASSLTLAPTDNGTLELLAQNGINSGTSRPWSVKMLDIGLSYRRGPLDPFAVVADTKMLLRIDNPTAATNFDRGFSPAHAGDADPARIYSMKQSLSAGVGEIAVIVPKALSVYSGKDLVLNDFQCQNNRPDDLSSFVAERSILGLQLRVSGGGDAVVQAGRDIDLRPGGFGRGIIAGGNQLDRTQAGGAATIPNAALPSNRSANIYLFAGGAGDADYSRFTAAYLDPQNGSHRVRTYFPELSSYLLRLGYGGLDPSQQLELFLSLPLRSREAFAQQILFTELKETGLDATDPSSPRFQSYARGYDAISLLFPRNASQLTRDQRSNIVLNARRVETQAGGDITMLAPYGRVDIGGASVTAAAESGGIITRQGGSIRILADQSIALFASRVFTLAGGDVLMWSSNGDIAAGVGSKTSVFRPPLSYTEDNDGRVTLNFFGLQTGAGIGVLDAATNGRRPRSRLDLIAPRGEVNAGDAGIRVVGDINIAALRVVGIENIQVSGNVAGVPKVIAPNIVALTEADKTVAAAAEKLGAAAQPKTKPEDLPSIVTVEAIGYETPDKEDSANTEERKRKRPGH